MPQTLMNAYKVLLDASKNVKTHLVATTAFVKVDSTFWIMAPVKVSMRMTNMR